MRDYLNNTARKRKEDIVIIFGDYLEFETIIKGVFGTPNEAYIIKKELIRLI